MISLSIIGGFAGDPTSLSIDNNYIDTCTLRSKSLFRHIFKYALGVAIFLYAYLKSHVVRINMKKFSGSSETPPGWHATIYLIHLSIFYTFYISDFLIRVWCFQNFAVLQ